MNCTEKNTQKARQNPPTPKNLAEAAAFKKLKAQRAARSVRDLAHFNSSAETQD